MINKNQLLELEVKARGWRNVDPGYRVGGGGPLGGRNIFCDLF
jgi:hypothetical protein